MWDGMDMRIKYIRLNNVQYADMKKYAALLPTERQDKIKRLRFDKDKLLSLIAGLMIRAEIGDTPLVLNEHGKPYAQGSDKYFSVSHSGEIVAITVDTDEIGVDVEALPEKCQQKLAERFYHPHELKYVIEADDKSRAFTTIWTRKEAYLKQLGIGIATDLKAFDTTSAELSKRLLSYDLEGYVLSICTENEISTNDIYISKLELKDIV